MIVAEQKPLEEIYAQTQGKRHVLIVGCRECVTVCQAGGEKEVGLLAAALRLKSQAEGREPIETKEESVQRQCDPEYVLPLRELAAEADLVISMACGVGVQYLAELLPGAWVVPALNTRFGGGSVEQGVWEERCGFCGDCLLDRTGGICPVARCSKSLLNGPCGGSHDGKCEVDEAIACGWQLIFDRLKGLDRLELLMELQPVKDWRTARDGGPRRVVREDLRT
jgi:ferredoxin